DKGALVPVQKNITVSQYWKFWSIECRSRVSEGWRSSQDQILRDYILPVIGNRKLVDIRSQDIGAILKRMQDKGRSPQTVLHVYNILHKMFGDAAEEFEFIGKNPVKRKHRPRVLIKERNFLSTAEANLLLEASKDHWLGPAIWIALYSALRSSELQGLDWKSVDFERDRIIICRIYNKKLRRLQDRPKQGDWGVAPVPPRLKAYLQGLRKDQADNDFVCRNALGDMLNYESLNSGLKELCRKAGIKVVTPHELRHSSTELYIDKGASAEDVRRLLNQKSLSATARYIHRTDERL
ncbi:MAG: hypothetical protein A3K03_13970, partial [Bdellovibrionales bacterium RIFOXYD1_FULL_44_7]